MKLFVTGGTGFIGSNFLNAALDSGHDVVALRRPKSVARIKLLKDPEWIEGQLNSNFSKKLKECDTLVHFASHSTNPPYDSLENCLYWNLYMSLNFFNQAYEAGIRNYLIAGSCFEYGRSGERYKEIPVTAPLEPVMSYPTSKAAASVAFQGWAVEKNINLQILRIFQVFGPGEPFSRLWPSLKKAAETGQDYPMTMGEQIRDFIPVEEVASLFVSALSFDRVAAGKPIIKNIGTGKPQSVRDFSEYWWKHWNAKGRLLQGNLQYRDHEIMRYVPKL
jgi:nucleoside-diphosphate-sugar epimerase